MKKTLTDIISDERVHVVDGAMGTMLYARGVFVNVCYDELNLKRPQLVQEVHEAYVQAGAEIIETNTFGANPIKLSAHGLDDQTETINKAAVQVARKAAGNKACVVGAIGPLGIRIEPFGPTAREEAVEYFQRQVSGLLEGGADGFMLETFADLDEIHAAFQAVRALSDLPIIAQMTVGQDGNTSYGTDVEHIGAALAEWEADVVGLNCSVGPAKMLDAIERLAEVTNLPICAQPNAGLPRAVGDRQIYLASPEYMAQYARRLIEAGARFVGGCCGTTPEHIKKTREYVASVQPRISSTVMSRHDVQPAGGVEPASLSQRSNWGSKLAAGELVTSVEILPPKGWDPSAMIQKCRAIKEAGIDAVNVLDSTRAQSRMGVLPTSVIIEREVGLETVMHYACRDRNMLGMESDLLGAAAAGLRNILIITGDPPTMGPYPDSTGVFDIDSIGLTNVLYRLNHGLDPGGNPIGEPTRYVIGVAMNQGASDLDKELDRFMWKVDAGADFAVTQPIFDSEQLENFLDKAKQWHIPIVGEIWPLISLRNAEFLANEVPGVHVPDPIIERMQSAEQHGAEAALAEGTRIAQEMFEQVRQMVQGVQVSAPLGRVEVALEVHQAVATQRAAQ
jgi:homocysteine S-methyltransferase